MGRVAFACLTALLSVASFGHGTEGRYLEILNWKKPNVARTFGSNRAHLDGIATTSNPVQARVIAGQGCVVGDLLLFDVDNAFAFDIDETVTLTLTYASDYSSPFIVAWDRNGGTGQGKSAEIVPQPAAGFQKQKLVLERARFAGQATQGADIAIGTRSGVAICDITLERSNSTPLPAAFGEALLTIKDGPTGRRVPARVGIYDATGRAPLASDDSLKLQRFADDLRMLAVNERTFWPSDHRQAFYVDGEYRARLPAGQYELVVTRGPEFRAHRSSFEIKSGATSRLDVSLQRYANLPAKGWYSGDAHVHVTRDQVADPQIWGFVAAEDVYVGNLLEMGNIAKLHFHQPQAWGKASRFERDGHFIVSGQEDPRTGHFGHTIHHNIQSPIRAPSDSYFLYHKVFQESARQGGISGFAHMGWNQAGSTGAGQIAPQGQFNRGLAILAPTGLVNFIEVLQRGRLIHEGWYRLLNLGYRINPAAGSDWPYSDFPGVVRNFVKLDGPLNLDAWFAAFRAGHTYVTNGPFLEFSINGRGMGQELKVKRGTVLDITAATQLNPDVDALDRLELIVLGEVAASAPAKGADNAGIRHQLVADRSMWIAVRSYGGRQHPDNMTIAHSTPIYVVVDDEPTWNRAALPTIVSELRQQLQRIMVERIEPQTGPEPWETRTVLAEEWLLQRPLLKPHVDAADAAYEQLLISLQKYTAQ
ncbi:MAG TPA: CehA/McbA family metallohydrolase [Steroidobacteraceae bacterium]